MNRLILTVALSGFALIVLSACQQGQSSAAESTAQQRAPGTIPGLLEQGFYGDDETVKSDRATAGEAQPDDNSVPDSNTEASDEDIVASIGFSTVADGQDAHAGHHHPAVVECNAQEATISPTQACEKISKRLASVSMDLCERAELALSRCESVEQFPILVREFPPLNGRQPQGRILVIGGTHGDELTSVSIVFRWIAKLNKHHSGMFHWRIAPMMNPDGVLKRGASRTNQRGVDLNRNLPSDDWDENALKYWAEKSGKNKRRYPGPHAASEPETQWLVNEIATFKPDAIISVHAPYGVVDYDSLILNAAPKSLGKLALNLLGTYPGSLGNYAGINRDIPVITLELPNAWEMPSDHETTRIWEDIVSWLGKNVNQPGQTASAN
ncbi:MAG: murein peptide amidase A [Gammaproteobacteria bacterium]|nr:murein peptide amidase A [Gammaproteobacteria bacterium]